MIPFSSLISQDMTPHFLIKFFYIFQVTKTKHMILNSWMQFIQISVMVKASYFLDQIIQKRSLCTMRKSTRTAVLECWLVLISLALLEYFNKVLSRLILWSFISLFLYQMQCVSSYRLVASTVPNNSYGFWADLLLHF